MLYFDHNATTPLAPEVAEAFLHAQNTAWGNASSVHSQGQAAASALHRARIDIGKCLGALPAEIVFTSGGTEANNLALFGVVAPLAPHKPVHIVTTAIEHPAVLGPCRELERLGVDVTYVGVDREGTVDAGEVLNSLRPETALVSVMHANNEVGTLQPIAEIARITRERGVLLHSDGVQAAGKLPLHLKDLGVDLYSLSGHKLHAPKGVGALYVRAGTALRPLQFGGRHERERRAGTENVPGAVALAKALQLAAAVEETRIRRQRDRFETELLGRLDEVEVAGHHAPRLGNTSNINFAGVRAEAIVIALDMNGIAVSTGSACSSGSVEPSHVLLAMGRTREEAGSSVRFSLGRDNTPADVDRLIDTLVLIVKKLRSSKNVAPAEVCAV